MPRRAGVVQMPPRQLTSFETPIAQAVVALGTSQNWEFAAYLETATGRLIEIRTLMRDDGADPSQDVHDKAAAGAPIVVHHNHLSQESLSFADWNGLATVFDETFAHCADGTAYWGRVLNHCCVQKIVCCSAQTIEMNAETQLFTILNGIGNAQAVALAGFFRKEVVNRAMRIRSFVEYEFEWGTGNAQPYVRPGAAPVPGPAGILGRNLNQHIDQAAANLAPSI
jgi:hypothetical protein